ncbi:hypothetical protein BJ944DRAFT_261367 [Cunninghamella echinulata]|nr:hypothetical protein BJ944DRAFT_261367 [Cunninghamella echinulata]
MFTKLISVTVFSSLFFVKTSLAADCPSGQFCAWTDSNYGGQRVNWSGDDEWWENFIADNDSSWANHGISGSGVKDHVVIYSGPHFTGDVVLCLAPGQEVASDSLANDNGASHKWVTSC